MKLPPVVREFFAKTGAKGGSKTGPTKARSPEHYARMAEIRAQNRLAKKAK